MTRRIIADIASMPIEQITAELAEVQAQKQSLNTKLEALQAEAAKLELEEQVLAQMLRLRQWKADGVPGASAAVAAVEANAPVGRRENVSANVLSVVRQEQGPLTPAEVRERLASNGVRADLNAIRVALRRWVDRDELIKRGRHYVDVNARFEVSGPADHPSG